MQFTLPDMSCGHCRGAVEKAVADADPGAEAMVDLSAKTVAIRTRRSEAEMAEALRAAGYPPAA
ncbi:MAG: heavy-metal-associated domain-containing protein [Shimia sp.]